jgi:hypothetical protein
MAHASRTRAALLLHVALLLNATVKCSGNGPAGALTRVKFLKIFSFLCRSPARSQGQDRHAGIVGELEARRDGGRQRTTGKKHRPSPSVPAADQKSCTVPGVGDYAYRIFGGGANDFGPCRSTLS